MLEKKGDNDADLLCLYDEAQWVEERVEQEFLAIGVGGRGYRQGMGRLQDDSSVHQLLGQVKPRLQEVHT